MPNIKMPDGQIVAFPDDMPREQINSMIFSRYPELQPEVPNAVKWAVNRMQKEGRTEPSLWENIVVGLSGAGQGAGTALSKGATVPTLGASDWALRKTGLDDSQARVNKIVDNTKSPMVAGLSGLVSGGLEVVGGLPLGAGTFKLAAGLPKYGRLAAGVGTSAGIGGISSAFNSDFNPEETTKGALLGAAFDLGLRGAGKGLAKVFSAAEKVKGVPRGLANVAADDKGAAILDRAVRESKKTAKQLYAQAPEAKDVINNRAIKQLDDAVRGVDVNEKVSSAKKAYDAFLEQNKSKQIVEGKFTPEEYQANLMKWSGGKEPIKVYHGTNKEFDVFDLSAPKKTDGGLMGNAIYVSPQKGYAQTYGKNLKELYINPKKTLTLSDTPREELKRILKGEISPKNQTNKEIAEKLGKYATRRPDVKKTLYDLNMEKGLYDDAIIDVIQSNKDAGNILKELGYDSTKFISSDGSVEYALYNPLNLKSVQNSGAFTDTASLTDKGVKAPVRVSDLGISDKLSNNQKEALEEAWKYGVNSLKPGEAVGSLPHINYMKNKINNMIGAEINKNPKVSKDMLVPLQELKDELSGIIEKANLPAVNKQYAEAMRIRDAFENGKNFNPNSQRVYDFKLKTVDERNAFAQGLAEKAKLNPESKNIAGKIADVRGALRETIGEKANPLFNNIDDLDRTYQNISNLRNLANRKLVKADPIGKLTAGPIREWGDSKLSSVFALADVARRWGTGNVAERAAKYLLNPNLKVGRSWNDAIQPAIPSIATFLANKRNRKGDK